jgi:hypothetical protein
MGNLDLFLEYNFSHLGRLIALVSNSHSHNSFSQMLG